MGYRPVSAVARLIAGAIAYIVIVSVAIWMLGSEAWSLFVVVGLAISAITGPVIGAAVVWLIVRRTNRRVGPKHGPHGMSSS